MALYNTWKSCGSTNACRTLCCLTSVRKTIFTGFTRWKSIDARCQLNSLVYSSVQDGAPASSLNVALMHSCNVRQITVTFCKLTTILIIYKKDLGQAGSCSSHFPFAQTSQAAHSHFCCLLYVKSFNFKQSNCGSFERVSWERNNACYPIPCPLVSLAWTRPKQRTPAPPPLRKQRQQQSQGDWPKHQQLPNWEWHQRWKMPGADNWWILWWHTLGSTGFFRGYTDDTVFFFNLNHHK